MLNIHLYVKQKTFHKIELIFIFLHFKNYLYYYGNTHLKNNYYAFLRIFLKGKKGTENKHS